MQVVVVCTFQTFRRLAFLYISDNPSCKGAVRVASPVLVHHNDPSLVAALAEERHLPEFQHCGMVHQTADLQACLSVLPAVRDGPVPFVGTLSRYSGGKAFRQVAGLGPPLILLGFSLLAALDQPIVDELLLSHSAVHEYLVHRYGSGK